MQVSKYRLNQKFNQEYQNLNEQQQKAVDTIEGPVMVIAGPGTGKTQILASRIGKILLETDALPENILCLTYTEAGVVAMRKRLLSFIGGTAYQVNIHTFHSFCNSVIQENIRFFNKKELEALSDLERVQYLKQLIDGFTKDNPLKRYKGEIYHDLHNLASLFSAIKREGWEQDVLLKQVDEYINNILPETEWMFNIREKAKGNLVLTQKGKDEVERMEKLKAAICSFKTYQEILHTTHRYDFDDMINWVIEIFQKHEEVLLNYQEQFQYILVDEYQDTSGSQNKIIEMLISYWQNESPNIFVVGDDDQSIYRFQGANLKNMTNLADTYKKDLVKIVLIQNYRSVQPILDAAKALIENNEQRLVKQYSDLNKDLIASNKQLKSLSILPVIRVYENEFAENAHVAASVKKLIEEGVDPGHIAIIYREHKFGDELIKFFQLQQIPFYVRRSIDLLGDVFTNNILNIIRYIIAELDTLYSGESLLFEILHYSFFNITPFKIATISNEVAVSRNKKENSSLRGYLQKIMNEASGTLFSVNEETDELIKVSKLIENLQKEVYNKSTQHWFEYMVNETGILAYIMQQEDRAWLMNKLTCLFDYIKESTHRKQELTLKQLIEQIDLLAENGLSLPLVQTTGIETGVNLLTGHGSKGLEYEYVFIVGARNDVWEGKRKTNRGFKLPPNVFERETESETTEELRRLFFVAVTRAEKHLYISYPKMKNDGKLLEPSQFAEEIREPLDLTPEIIKLTEEEKTFFSSLRFGIIQKPVLAQVEKDYINRLLQNFVMNVTALNNYIDCPLRFYYSSLVRVPSAKSEAAQFGTAVHQALSDFLNYMMNNNKIYAGKQFLIQRYLYHINNGREVFTQESLQRFIEYGEEILSKYYDKYYDPAPQGDFILTEYPLTKVVINDIPLKGFTDKIQFWKNDIIITDYKTGSLVKANKRWEFAKPGEREEKPQGGNYWRQAVFYKILVDNLPGKNWKVLSTQFDFVEPNTKHDFDIEKLNITAEEVEQVKEQITTTWEQIQQHNFYTGCGKPECEWCNFAKNNKLYVKLQEEEETLV